VPKNFNNLAQIFPNPCPLQWRSKGTLRPETKDIVAPLTCNKIGCRVWSEKQAQKHGRSKSKTLFCVCY